MYGECVWISAILMCFVDADVSFYEGNMGGRVSDIIGSGFKSHSFIHTTMVSVFTCDSLVLQPCSSHMWQVQCGCVNWRCGYYKLMISYWISKWGVDIRYIISVFITLTHGCWNCIFIFL